jgi:hypothetical protein
MLYDYIYLKSCSNSSKKTTPSGSPSTQNQGNQAYLHHADQL